ncbi:MAG: PhoH family protein [Erysipelotrichaceae bacterium]|nr:PhoH family protein [Erysipelotrichaceae bacterium]
MNVFGNGDGNLKLIAESLKCQLGVEDNQVFVTDESKKAEAENIFREMVEIYKSKKHIATEDVVTLLNNGSTSSFYKKPIANGYGSRSFYLRTKGQKTLYEAFEKHDITIVTGPAGTGKTFLAVVYASNLLKQGLIRKIIVTRPVVEAGESLGFLPGDLKEKVDPYLIPIYDSFAEIFGQANVEKMMEKGVIEVAPLAYMRGRTLNDAVVILDEAQNTTGMQIKMFMTRLGFNSKMIITGDVTQVDLPASKPSGLVKAISIVKDIDEIAIIEMSRKDVVRHPLVQKIIEAYEKQ